MTIATLIAPLVFTGAVATALGVIATTVAPQRHRIRALLSGARPVVIATTTTSPTGARHPAAPIPRKVA